MASFIYIIPKLILANHKELISRNIAIVKTTGTKLKLSTVYSILALLIFQGRFIPECLEGDD